MTAEESSVWEANVTVHAKEAVAYDNIHLEIFNAVEQKRLVKNLKMVSKLVTSPSDTALDFGCGTGNITQKLIRLGWKVIAADSSPEMLDRLKRKLLPNASPTTLVPHLLTGKHLSFEDKRFGLVTAYSVFHHLYDYMFTLQELCRVLDRGGVLYIDHEVSDSYWNLEQKRVYRIYEAAGGKINQICRKRFLRQNSAKIPRLNYTLSDYRTKESTRIEWDKVKRFLLERGFTVREHTYLLHKSIVLNPLYPFYRLFLRNVEDMRTLICIKE